MKRILVALSTVFLPMLSLAAPPITEPVDVNVTNPVLQVEVSNADPIPVAVSSSSAPYQFELCLKEGNGTCSRSLGGVVPSSVGVPQGKTLVIEFITAYCGLLPSPNFLYRLVLRTTVGTVSAEHHIPGINPAFVAAQQARIYADPGSTVTFADILQQSSGDAACFMTISGQLVDP
jgi:hypothetical protein